MTYSDNQKIEERLLESSYNFEKSSNEHET